ncbi:MAG: BamA/TamA family outer membrane protein [Dysgonomonas sp.]
MSKKNSLFDLDMLDEERDRVSSSFRRFGYYEFDKEYIGFVADTLTQGKDKVSLELTVYPYMQKRENGEIIESKHRQFVVKEVNFYVDYNPLEDINIGNYKPTEVVERDNGLYKIFYGEKGRYIKPHIILNSCFITPGALYSENATSTTYNSLSQLHILRNVNIRYQEIIDNDSTKLLCIITCVPDKKQAISVEAEGTNSDGRFGVGASIGYTHRNLFRGSELFNAKLRGSYEAISADFSNFDKNYFEIGGETSITFPRFMFPFLKRDLRRRLHASTQLTANYTYQRRPDYFTRTILSTRLSYLWQNRRNNSIKHSVDLVNVSYVHIPESKLNMSFINKLTSAAREFSFTDQFILGSGYTYTNTNLNLFSSKRRRQTSIYSLRANVETAGNLLSLVAAMAGAEKDSLGSKKIFGTRFVQYVLGNVDYSRTIYLDEKNSIAWRVGGGVVYPYGNYKMVPIQKRFYSGGANSVRGWGIRELGPGSFYKPDATFYDQSGEIRFDANIEYRSKVFWKFELAAFLDAGNIWTIKKYEEQEKGNFSFGSFYKEIAFAWGLGLRLDFDYVLIRLDCGWKLYDPADRYKHYDYDDNTRQWIPDAGRGMKSKWPVLKPFDIGHNTAWHIAVGYPF